MNQQAKILFGITTKSHTEIALDEMYGLREIGYTCDGFEFGGKKNVNSRVARFFVILQNSIKLLNKVYEFRPDFVYLNSRVEYIGSARDFITIIIIKLFYYKKLHFLIKSHGSDLEVLQTEKFVFKKIIFPFLKRYVRGWLFLSTEELNWVASRKLIVDERLFLTKNIVRLEKFQVDNNFRAKYNIPADHKILLFVGRIIHEKGIHFVLDAFIEIRKKYKVFLIIVGDGEELAALNEKIAFSNIQNEVLVTGWIEESEAAYFTANSDILIFPTFFPEGFPMALFNSMAAGLSIITTPTRAAYDYLDEPANCLWVEPRSSLSIILALEKMLASLSLMEQMGINNKRKSHLFSKSFVSKELSQVINSILTNKYDKNLQVVRTKEY